MIQYDKPIKVSEKTYGILMRDFGQIIAGRKDKEGNFFIKLWLMRYQKHLTAALTQLEK